MDRFTAIRVFCRVVELKSFTKAADSLDMPKTTVSKMIADLEGTLRAKLLSRTTRSVVATAEGAAYYAQTSRWLRELDDIDSAFEADHVNLRGRVQVDLSGWVASAVVIPRLPAFHARHPGIKIELNISDQPTHLLRANSDCAVRGGALADTAMVGRLIGQSRLVTAAAPSYLALHGTPADPQQLEQGHYLISYQFASSGRPMPFRFHAPDRDIEIAGAWQVSVNESNAHLAAGLAGMGVLNSFEWKLRPYVDDGRLVPILADWQAGVYPFYIVYPPNRYRNQRVRVVIDWLSEVFAGLDEVAIAL
ncbi:LysR family transcriptional regulator [Duganella aceris]|uniref:LysR family transcriptional regulator n=1 Tax=Duganella aceris TaxID=2703883 RepID=A0ABX0FL42_9BURK|nr:LysR family transcriptional regulator [Duganella aceris]NGZ85266.1 LysR family transcriptional regulator [Duganella aceris]